MKKYYYLVITILYIQSIQAITTTSEPIEYNSQLNYIVIKNNDTNEVKINDSYIITTSDDYSCLLKVIEISLERIKLSTENCKNVLSLNSKIVKNQLISDKNQTSNLEKTQEILQLPYNMSFDEDGYLAPESTNIIGINYNFEKYNINNPLATDDGYKHTLFSSSIKASQGLPNSFQASIGIEYLFQEKIVNTKFYEDQSTIYREQNRYSHGISDPKFELKKIILRDKININGGLSFSPKFGSKKHAQSYNGNNSLKDGFETATEDGNNFRGSNLYGLGLEFYKKDEKIIYFLMTKYEFESDRESIFLYSKIKVKEKNISRFSILPSLQYRLSDKLSLRGFLNTTSNSSYTISAPNKSMEIDSNTNTAFGLGIKYLIFSQYLASFQIEQQNSDTVMSKDQANQEEKNNHYKMTLGILIKY